MTTEPNVKLQYFVDSMRARAVDIENVLLGSSLSQEKVKIHEARLEILSELIDNFERLFHEILCEEPEEF